MTRRDIISVGGIVADVILELPQLPGAGRCIAATSLYSGPGGKAANQAVAAARLGGRVALVGATGRDATGDWLLATIAAEGVDVSGVRREADVPTSVLVLQKDRDGRAQTAVYPGANARVDARAVNAAAESIRAARVVMVQLEIPLDGVRRALELAREGGARAILDPSPARPLPPELIRHASVIRANAGEARMLTGVEVTDLDSARAAAARLLDLGVELVSIEAGKGGNLFATRDAEVFLPLVGEIEPVDKTGAGDTLTAALAVALTENLPLRAAAELANAAAALATRSPGAQTSMPSRDEVARLLGRHE